MDNNQQVEISFKKWEPITIQTQTIGPDWCEPYNGYGCGGDGGGSKVYWTGPRWEMRSDNCPLLACRGLTRIHCAPYTVEQLCNDFSPISLQGHFVFIVYTPPHLTLRPDKANKPVVYNTLATWSTVVVGIYRPFPSIGSGISDIKLISQCCFHLPICILYTEVIRLASNMWILSSATWWIRPYNCNSIRTYCSVIRSNQTRDSKCDGYERDSNIAIPKCHSNRNISSGNHCHDNPNTEKKTLTLLSIVNLGCAVLCCVVLAASDFFWVLII